MLLFLVLQQLEGHIVAPQIFSHSLRINPLVVIFVLLLGGHLHGIVGALVALPLAAIGRETAMYLRRHLVLEPWGTPSAAALREIPAGRSATEPQAVPGVRHLNDTERAVLLRLRSTPAPTAPAPDRGRPHRAAPRPAEPLPAGMAGPGTALAGPPRRPGSRPALERDPADTQPGADSADSPQVL